MEDGIRDGDRVLVDTSITDPENGEVYLIKIIGDGMPVKRLRRVGHEWLFLSAITVTNRSDTLVRVQNRQSCGIAANGDFKQSRATGGNCEAQIFLARNERITCSPTLPCPAQHLNPRFSPFRLKSILPVTVCQGLDAVPSNTREV